MGYTVGSLELPISASAKGAVGDIEKTIEHLEKLYGALNKLSSFKMDTTGLVSATNAVRDFSLGVQTNVTNEALSKVSSVARAMTKIQEIGMSGSSLANYSHITTFFREVSNASTLVDTQSLDKISAVASSLGSISSFSRTIGKIDFDKATTGFQKLATAIKPFLDLVNQSTQSLSALDNVLSKVGSKKLQSLNPNQARGGGFGSFLSIARMGTSLRIIQRLGRFTAQLVQDGSDYTETLNMWQVSMRENLDLADKFIIKMNKAYGISEKTLMQAQATFKNMIGSLGNISEETAYALSETVTQLAVDYSSLYNVQLTKAFEKFQAMLAGQVRPIRSVSGLDITETTLYALYQSIGGTKTMRQLNRTEDQLLSILAVFQQMGRSGALGDMTKTLNQFANQSRMMTEYWAQLKAWTGLVLKDLIDQSGALIYINALLITASEIMRAIAKSRGADDENFIDGLFESTNATNEAIDELQGKLLSIDKFRSLNSNKGNAFGIDKKLLEAITGYSSQIDKAENKAQDLANSWLKALGFTEGANGELEISEEKLESIQGTISNVFKILGAIAGIKIGTNIINGISKISQSISSIRAMSSGLQTALRFLYSHPVISGILLVIGWIGVLYTKSEEVRDSVDRMFEAFKRFGSALGNLFSEFDVLFEPFLEFERLAIALVDALRIGIDLLTLAVRRVADEVDEFLKPLEALTALAGYRNSVRNSDAYGGGGGGARSASVVSSGISGGARSNVSGQVQQATRAGTMDALSSWWRSARNDLPQFDEASATGLYTVVTERANGFGNGWGNK